MIKHAEVLMGLSKFVVVFVAMMGRVIWGDTRASLESIQGCKVFVLKWRYGGYCCCWCLEFASLT